MTGFYMKYNTELKWVDKFNFINKGNSTKSLRLH